MSGRFDPSKSGFHCTVPAGIKVTRLCPMRFLSRLFIARVSCLHPSAYASRSPGSDETGKPLKLRNELYNCSFRPLAGYVKQRRGLLSGFAIIQPPRYTAESRLYHNCVFIRSGALTADRSPCLFVRQYKRHHQSNECIVIRHTLQINVCLTRALG